MRLIRAAFAWLIGTIGRARHDTDLTAELDAHLESHIGDNLRAGMTQSEARRHALLRLGGVEITKDRYREQRGVPIVDSTARGLRHAFERLRRSPGFTTVAVLSLALAIGANVAIFAVVERVLLNPLPYPESGRLIALEFGMPARNIPAGFNSITSRQYVHYVEHARTLDGVTVYRTEYRTLTGEDAPERVLIARTTPSLTPVLRVVPASGRWFVNGEGLNGAASVAVLSYGLWTRRYGADPAILGRAVTLDGISTTVIGIMPASFSFQTPRVDAWIPEPFSPQAGEDDSFTYTGVARLRPGITILDARAEINQLTRGLDAAYPGNGYAALVSTALSLQEATVGQITTTLWILLGSAGIVLLVACANIANLFLVRSEARQREIALRRALGAGTGGIASYFFAESACLCFAGGVLGIAAASYGVHVLVALGPRTLPRLTEIRLTSIHMFFAAVLSSIAALLFGVVPLLRFGSSRVSLHDSGRGTTATARSSHTRQLLMAAQVALALVLLVASGLLFRSFQRLQALDLGFNPTSALTFQIGLPRSEYPNRQAIVAAHQAILDRLNALPGVSAASATNCLPLSERGFCGGAPLFVEGEPVRQGANANRPIVAIRPVAASFVDAMGMRLIRGRSITRDDMQANDPVAVINDALARVAFPGQDALGKRIRLGPHVRAQLWFTIVGVVKTTPTVSLGESQAVSKMYVPLFAARDVWPVVDVLTYVVRTASSPLALAAPARAAVKSVDPNLALAQVRTLQSFIDVAAAPRAFTMVLILMAATTALLLGVIGVYCVMSYIVSQRTNEIGVRIALGAEPGRVMRMVVAQGGLVTVGGVAIGLAAALAGGRAISSLLYEVSPRDPEVFATTTLMLLAIALVACWLPARRAASVDPLIALRD